MADTRIGQSFPRTDAYAKVTGRALYTGDQRPRGCLVAKILRSPLPHARILGIDASLAADLPGVKAVLTARDLPDRRYGFGIQDQPVLAREGVRFVGERVAAVAAVDEETALKALDLIEVTYEELPTALDPLAAMQPGAPVVHPGLAHYRGGPKEPDRPNVLAHVTFGIGELETGFRDADYVFEDTFHTAKVHQGYLEAHTCLVQITGETVQVWSANKAPFELRGQLAGLLDLPVSVIEVITPTLGGDFGGKGPLMDEPVAYYLARKSGCPVYLAMTAAEELMAGNPRHAAVIVIKSGVTKDGHLTARHVQIMFDSGAYGGANSNVPVGGVRRALGAYRIGHTRIDGYAVYTNTVPCGHCRAPGDPQVFFAVESHTDMLAARLGLDPVDFRRLNVLREGDVSPSGLSWRDIRAREVLDLAVAQAGWGRPKPAQNWGRGLALTERAVGAGASSAHLMVHPDASVTVVTGATDPGTGSHTVLRQIAAQVLRLPVTRVKLGAGSTRLAPYDKGSGSSRVTHVAGQAVRLAAKDALNKIGALAAGQLGCAPGALVYDEGVFAAPDGRRLTVQAVFDRLGRSKDVIIGEANYVAERIEHTCFTCQVAEVEVDPETGAVRVQRIISVNDLGTALNPAAARGQITGAVVQGLGYALFEELPYTGGQPVVRNLADYTTPTALDAPAIESFLLEGAAGPGPFGAKSIGEQPIAATAPAIANAIYDAVGVRITTLPITSEKLQRALKSAAGTTGTP